MPLAAGEARVPIPAHLAARVRSSGCRSRYIVSPVVVARDNGASRVVDGQHGIT